MYDYAVNDGAIEELCNDLKDAHDKLVGADGSSGIVKEIYDAIDALSEAWTGDSYETFKTMCHSYEKPVYFLGDIIDAYRKLYAEGSVNEAKTTLYSNVETALEEMKG